MIMNITLYSFIIIITIIIIIIIITHMGTTRDVPGYPHPPLEQNN